MASSSSSAAQQGGELILAASHGRPITAYDALTGDVVAEFPAANTPRHGLAVAAGPGTATVVAASHVCPATGTGSIRLLQWWSPAPARELPVPEPVAPLVAAPYGSHILAGSVSGRMHAVALPSGDVATSFLAHGNGAAVSCLALNDDGSLLVSGGDDGGVAVFPLIAVLDVDRRRREHRRPPHRRARRARDLRRVLPRRVQRRRRLGLHRRHVQGLETGRRGHLRTFALPCAALSFALDATSSNLYAGGSDGRVHVASLSPAGTTTTVTTTAHASDGANAAALVAVAMANGGKNLVSCSEDGEVRVWDLTHGLVLLANTFWIRGGVSRVLAVKRLAGELARGGGGEGFKVHDAAAWTRTREVAEMDQMLRSSEEDKARSVELIEMNVSNYRRCLQLVLREVNTVANGGRRNGVKDGNVSD